MGGYKIMKFMKVFSPSIVSHYTVLVLPAVVLNKANNGVALHSAAHAHIELMPHFCTCILICTFCLAPEIG